MTSFEVMILERLDAMTLEVGRLATNVARLEERQKGQDDRLTDLEDAPAMAACAPDSGLRRSRGWRENGGLYLSNATITAAITALLTYLARDPAPPAPAAPRPPPPVIAGAP